MKDFFYNILLALLWVFVTGSFTLVNLAFGFVIAAMAMALINDESERVGYIQRSRRVVSLAVFFLGQLLLSAWRVAMVVLTPKMNLKPGIFAYPLQVETDFQITLLANMITLTPGTLSVDVSEDRSTLYVHALDCSDPDGARQEIADGFERKILEAFP
ncbi:Na+/H+ antiporter subunit E [Consotaella aegiceratis]|uniref:Na+/H+ antiporter subunit E n=1 Tax=Consotaella aegiceratis TaxID=3097961 RepID=UPI002F3F32BF